MSEAERITKLEERLGELEDEQQAVRSQLLDAQIELWEGRLDDLGVQLHLLSMEARDRLQPVIDQLQSKLADARSTADKRSGTASDVVAELRSGLQSAVDDVRSAVRDAAKAARS